jgi:hypothetical protein
MSQNISTLTQAYIEDVYNRIQSGNLTPEESALLVAGLQNLQQNTDLTSVILGIAQSSNDALTAGVSNLISRLETLEGQMSASLQSHLPPLVPLNGTHDIHHLVPNGSYSNYTDSDGFNYVVNFNDEVLGRMYIATTQRSGNVGSNIIDFEFGYYQSNGQYVLLNSVHLQNHYDGNGFERAGAFILPLAASPTDNTRKVCIIFYSEDSIWFLEETNLNAGALKHLTANEPRTYLVYDRQKATLVFMPDTSKAYRLYADKSTELVEDYPVSDSNQFESAFWGNANFLQLRGDNTPYWQCGPYTNTEPANMGTRTFTGSLFKYFYFAHTGSGPFVEHSWNFRPCKKLFQIPFTIRRKDETIEFRKIIFNPDIQLVGVKQSYANATNPAHFTYIITWKGNQNWLLDEQNNVLFSAYTNNQYVPYHLYIYKPIYQEPICFDLLNKRIATRVVDWGSLTNNYTAQHYVVGYQV